MGKVLLIPFLVLSLAPPALAQSTDGFLDVDAKWHGKSKDEDRRKGKDKDERKNCEHRSDRKFKKN